MEINVIQKTNRKITETPIEGTNLVKFKEVVTTDTNGEISISTYYGVTEKESLDKVNGLEHIPTKIKAPRMYRESAYPVAISHENMKKLLSAKAHVYDNILEEIDENNIDSDEYDIILYNSASYKIADLKLDFISIPVFFDYSNEHIDNHNFDLEELLEFLKSNECIVDRENLQIKDIPYYNCEEGRTKTIEFNCLIPTEEYNKIAGEDSYNGRNAILY